MSSELAMDAPQDHSTDRYALLGGDCRVRLRELQEGFFDSCVTDPPYSLSSIRERFSQAGAAPAQGAPFARLTRGFMGKSWDNEVAFDPATWIEVLRVMKPGAHLLAFGGTRTAHRLACAIEDAGFELRDCLMWVYGTGFPKSHDLGEGRGTALKPAYEPIYLARKPFDGTTEACVEKYGTGGINVDACRIGTTKDVPVSPSNRHSLFSHGAYGLPSMTDSGKDPTIGRWPANLIHDGSGDVLSLFPESNGPQGDLKPTGRERPGHGIFGAQPPPGLHEARGDVGSSARFFYCAKASRLDREEGLDGMPTAQRDTSRSAEQPSMNGGEGNPYNRGAAPRANHHPTVKPTDLMRYLCRLITPPCGTVLDPFTGSGSTGKAAMYEGLSFIGCEMESAYLEIAKRRIDWAARGSR